MAKWKYTLKNGKALRNAINKDSNEETLEALRKCYEEIHEAMPDEYTEEDLYRDIDDIENQLDNCENYFDYDMTEDDVQDEVNYLLSNFYDLCDGLRIWVDLN
jgi:hypothetical protein